MTYFTLCCQRHDGVGYNVHVVADSPAEAEQIAAARGHDNIVVNYEAARPEADDAFHNPSLLLNPERLRGVVAMPKFTVVCALRETGAQYSVDVPAESPGHAVAIAAQMGHLAERAYPSPPPRPDPVVYHDAPRPPPVFVQPQPYHDPMMLAELRRLRAASEAINRRQQFSVGRVLWLFVFVVIGIPLLLFLLFTCTQML